MRAGPHKRLSSRAGGRAMNQKYFDFEIMGIRRRLPYVKVSDSVGLASFVCIFRHRARRDSGPEARGEASAQR